MYLAEIDGTQLNTKKEFMQAMNEAFGFPPYFSDNWDSLHELMRDPFWIRDNKIVLKITNSKYFSGKLRVYALDFLNEVKEHLENPNTKQELNYTLNIELD